MKRISACILAVLMLLLTFASLTVSAAKDPCFVVDQISATPGETVSINISVENNPGIASIKLFVAYSEYLTVTEVSYNESILGGESLPPQDMESVPNPMILNWYNGSQNVNGDWVWATVKFKVAENVPIGATLPISVTYNANDIYNIDETNLNFSIRNGTVTVTEAKSTITEASFELSSSINANVYVDLADAHAGAKMRFTMHGEETLVEGVATDREGIWKYQFKGISPQCMGDAFKAELILDGTVLDVIEEYSVRIYCDALFASTAAELNLSQAKFDAAKTMMADLLEYGAMSQKYRSYKTDSLVNEGITGQSVFRELEAAWWDKELGATSTPGTELTGANVWFDNEIRLCFKFTAPGCTDTNFSVKVTDSDTGETNEYTLSDFEVLSAENNLYHVLSEPVPVAHFGHYFTVTLNSVTFDRRGNRIVTPIQTLDYYGVNAYVFAKQNDRGQGGELTPMAYLARAAYCYGDSAAAYDSI